MFLTCFLFFCLTFLLTIKFSLNLNNNLFIETNILIVNTYFYDCYLIKNYDNNHKGHSYEWPIMAFIILNYVFCVKPPKLFIIARVVALLFINIYLVFYYSNQVWISQCNASLQDECKKKKILRKWLWVDRYTLGPIF